MKETKIPAIVPTLALLVAFFLPWGYSSVIGPAYFRINSLCISDFYFVVLMDGLSSLFGIRPVGHVGSVLIRDVYIGYIATMILYPLALVFSAVCLISKRVFAILLSGIFALGAFLSFYYANTMLSKVIAQEFLTGPIALQSYTVSYHVDVGALIALMAGVIYLVVFIVHVGVIDCANACEHRHGSRGEPGYGLA